MVNPVGLFPTINASTYLYVTTTTIRFRGVTSRCNGAAIPRATKSLWVTKSLWGTEWLRGAKNFQQCHKYFIQYSKCASIRPQIQMWGRQIWFLPRTPSDFVTPLVSCRSTLESWTALQGRNKWGQGHKSRRAESLCERRITAGSAENLNSITSAFFSAVHLLPKDLRFQHGGAKVASCPRRQLTRLVDG